MSGKLQGALKNICEGVSGAYAASIMGMDGIAVDTFTKSDTRFDVQSLIIEYSGVLSQAGKSAQMFDAGPLEELSIHSENLTTIIRPINRDYFVALALRPDANFGKGRYLLRRERLAIAEALA